MKQKGDHYEIRTNAQKFTRTFLCHVLGSHVLYQLGHVLTMHLQNQISSSDLNQSQHLIGHHLALLP